jgi:MFS family permease
MSAVERLPIKKAFLYLLVASVLLSAFLGIVAILSGRFGWFEVRIILTTVTIAIGSICGLACGAVLGMRAGRVLPLSGILLTIVAAAMIITGMWLEPESVLYWKLAASIAVFAVACAHLCLLSIARLSQWFQWSLGTAYVIIFGVASLIAVIIFFEVYQAEMFRLLGVAAIADAAITVLIPIFHRLSRSELELISERSRTVDIEAIDREIQQLKSRIAELERLKQARLGQ